MPTLGRTLVRARRADAAVRSGHPLGVPQAGARDQAFTLDQYAAMMSDYLSEWGVSGGPFEQTWKKEPAERVGQSMAALGEQAYRGSGLVFAIMAVRMAAFSLVRFTYQRIRGGRPADLFGTPSLGPLETPWPSGSTQDLLSRMLLDVDLAGNSYHIRNGPWMHRLHPTWVQILLEPIEMNGGIVGYRKAGYTYHHGGIEVCPPEQVALFGTSEVAHFAPTPDPHASYRGMSWMTAAIREIANDKTMERHKQRFFENAAPQPLSAPVLTPRGWSTMGAMLIGSEVVGSDGKPHRVTGVFPQGEQSIYRVSFADGSEVECTEDHVWAVQSLYDRKRGVGRLMTTAEIAEQTHYASGAAKWAVPFADPIEFAGDEPLPVDPWLLGALLGDGCMTGPGGATLAAAADDADDTAALLAAHVPAGVTVSRRDRGGWSEFYLGSGGKAGNPLRAALEGLDVWGTLGPDKRVPAAYLRASIADRLALLRGLLDTDGSVDRRQPNLVRFISTSRALAENVRELARSLGGTATIAETSRGQWRVHVQRLPEAIVPFALSRKANVYTPPGNRGERSRSIVGVEYVRREEAQCIRVDVPDSLYVTSDYVLTHNTPNIAVALDKSISPEDFERFKAIMDEEHVGAENAYKTLYLGGGADVKVVGSNFEQLQMASVQGRGETRVAAAAGVPAVIVGLSEGLSSATYSNYGQAMRRFADLTMATLWANAAASLQTIIRPPGGDARLWYDTRDVSFLREDREVAARIEQTNAATINTYITAGFTPESAILAVKAGDPALLIHTGMVSVQLQTPGANGAIESGAASSDAAPASDSGGTTGPATVADAKKEADATNAADPASGLNGQTPAEIRLLMEMIQKVYLGIGKVITVEEARDLLNRAGADLPALPADSPLLAPPPAPPGPPAANDAPADDAAPGDDSGDDSGTGSGDGTNSAEPVYTARAAIVPYDPAMAARAVAGPSYDQHDAAILEYIARDFAARAREARGHDRPGPRPAPVARTGSDTARDWVDYAVAAEVSIPMTNGVHS